MTVEVQGHRGARGLAPENTLPGFATAFELGVDVVELDVVPTRDGVLVLHHDPELSPRSDPDSPYHGIPIRELTYQQVTEHTQIPTLDQVCVLLDGYDPRPLLAIELKTDPSWADGDVTELVAEVARLVRGYGFQERSRLLGFDWRVLAAARRLAPEFGLVALAERKTLQPDTAWLAGRPEVGWVDSAAELGAAFVSPEDAITTPELVAHAHGVGLGVAVWTVNDPAEMSRFLDMEVDALITDRPDLLREVLGSRCLPLPVPAKARRPDRVR